MWRRLALVALIGVLALSASAGGIYFKTAAGWNPPPVYHGNPFAPGGVGGAWWWVFEPLFVYIPGAGDTIPSGVFAGQDRLIPRLAIGYKEYANGFLVELRRGVKWHDGAPFTSKDVLCTYKLLYLKGDPIWRYLKGIYALDDYTVIFIWKEPTALAKPLIARDVICYPYHIYGKWADRVNLNVPTSEEPNKSIIDELLGFKPKEVVGTGPFKLKTVTASEMLLVKNPDHWAADKISFAGVDILRWTSNQVVQGYLKGGEIDAAHPATLKDATEEILKSQPGMKLALPSDLAEFAVAFNTREYPYSELAFRKAVAYILDRDEVRKVCYYYALSVNKYAHGVLKSFEDQWLSKDFLGSLEVYTPNTAKAEELLQSLGWKRGSDGKWVDAQGKPVKLEITAPAAWSDWCLAAANIADQLTAFGLTTEFRPTPNEVYGSNLKAGKYGMAIEFEPAWWGFAHPWAGYDRMYGAKGYMRQVLGLDESMPDLVAKAQALVDKLAVTLDLAGQKALVEQLAKLTNENVPCLPFLEKRLMIFHLDGVRVTGWPANDDPVWMAASGGIERVYSTLMVEGILQAVK